MAEEETQAERPRLSCKLSLHPRHHARTRGPCGGIHRIVSMAATGVIYAEGHAPSVSRRSVPSGEASVGWVSLAKVWLRFQEEMP
jgi:hypothetical protein